MAASITAFDQRTAFGDCWAIWSAISQAASSRACWGTTWFARPKRPRTQTRLATASQAAKGLRQNIADLAGHPLLVGSVLAVNTALLVAGGVLYFGYDSAEVFVEGGLMNTVGSAELVLAGAFGLLAFVFFWRGAISLEPRCHGLCGSQK